jgi:peptidoglycan/LPS O-acetylase OafA/YrhL
VFGAVHLVYEWTTSLPGAHEPSTVLSIIFYYSNTSLRSVPFSPGLGHLWSLAVEEQFYLLWPLCLGLFFGLRRRLTPIVVVLVGAIVIVAFHRADIWNHGTWWVTVYTQLSTRADALLAGCVPAQLWVRISRSSPRSDATAKRGYQRCG